MSQITNEPSRVITKIETGRTSCKLNKKREPGRSSDEEEILSQNSSQQIKHVWKRIGFIIELGNRATKQKLKEAEQGREKAKMRKAQLEIKGTAKYAKRIRNEELENILIVADQGRERADGEAQLESILQDAR